MKINLYNDDCFNVLKTLPDESMLAAAKKFDKQNHADQVKKNMFPFETLFFELGAEVLKNVEGFLAANPDKAVQNVRKQVAKAIGDVRRGGDLKKLTQGYFGPASHYSRYLTGCKGVCQQWDALQSQGRTQARCNCQDLDTCDQNTYFWMCKTLYECREADEHRNDFCNGCGTGQRDEFDFYDELDCGAGGKVQVSLLSSSFVMTFFLLWWFQ